MIQPDNSKHSNTTSSSHPEESTSSEQTASSEQTTPSNQTTPSEQTTPSNQTTPSEQTTPSNQTTPSEQTTPDNITPESTVIDRLYETILQRKTSDPRTSYTASLFAQGQKKILSKVVEETKEAIIEAMIGTPQKFAEESADLLYHLLVAWAYKEITPKDVYKILKEREGISGITEKSLRVDKEKKNP